MAQPNLETNSVLHMIDWRFSQLFNSNMAQATQTNKMIEDNFKRQNTTLHKISSEIDRLNVEAKQNRQGIEDLLQDQECIIQRLDNLERLVDANEEEAKRCNLKFFGVTETGRQVMSTISLIVDVLNYYSAERSWKPEDINRAYRVGERRDYGAPRPIIVHFQHWADKMDLLTDQEMRYKLRQDNIRFTSELTTHQRITVEMYKTQGKTAFFKNGRLQVIDKDRGSRNPKQGRDEQEDSGNFDDSGVHGDDERRQDRQGNLLADRHQAPNTRPRRNAEQQDDRRDARHHRHQNTTTTHQGYFRREEEGYNRNTNRAAYPRGGRDGGTDSTVVPGEKQYSEAARDTPAVSKKRPPILGLPRPFNHGRRLNQRPYLLSGQNRQNEVDDRYLYRLPPPTKDPPTTKQVPCITPRDSDSHHRDDRSAEIFPFGRTTPIQPSALSAATAATAGYGKLRATNGDQRDASAAPPQHTAPSIHGIAAALDLSYDDSEAEVEAVGDSHAARAGGGREGATGGREPSPPPAADDSTRLISAASGRTTTQPSAPSAATAATAGCGKLHATSGDRRDTSAAPPQHTAPNNHGDAAALDLNCDDDDDSKEEVEAVGDSRAARAGGEEGATGRREPSPPPAADASTRRISAAAEQQRRDGPDDRLAQWLGDDPPSDKRPKAPGITKGITVPPERERMLRDSTTRQRASSQPNITDAFKKTQKNDRGIRDTENVSQDPPDKTPTSGP